MTILVGSAPSDYDHNDRIYVAGSLAEWTADCIESLGDWQCLGEYTIDADGIYVASNDLNMNVKAGQTYQLCWADDGMLYYRTITNRKLTHTLS